MTAVSVPRFLITTGPTRAYIDPVRFITNASSGRMGFALASAAQAKGCPVTLIAGPTAITPPEGIAVRRVMTTEEMCEAVCATFSSVDIVIMAAAPCDFTPTTPLFSKMKKQGCTATTLALTATPDILATLAARKAGQILIGFAAETNDMEAYALDKLRRKKCDMILANDVGAPDAGFEADALVATLYYADGRTHVYGRCAKAEIAKDIIARACALFTGDILDVNQVI